MNKLSFIKQLASIRNQRWYLLHKILGSVLLVLTAIILLLAYQRQQRLLQLKTAVSSLAAAMTDFEQKVRDKNQLAVNKEQLEANFKQRQLQNGRQILQHWQQQLLAIAELVPAEIILQAISLQPWREISLQGNADHVSAVADFLTNLLSLGAVETGKLEFVKAGNSDQHDSNAFAIKLKLAAHE